MLENFWKQYQSYKDSESNERIAVPLAKGTAEIYHAMGTIRSSFRGAGEVNLQDMGFQGPFQDLVKKHKLTYDFRDESYVVSDEDGTYLGRIRSYEMLFTPSAFEGKEAALEEMIRLFSSQLK